jgi:hypothetical protein
MKPFQSTLILLIIVAAVGGYIWFNERGPIAEQGSTVLLRTDPARVQKIVLTHDDQSIALQKSGDIWKAQQQPKQAGSTPSESTPSTSTPSVPADKDAVKSLLDGLQLLQSASVVPADKEKLKEFGLDKPKSRLNVDGTEIQFGTSPSYDTSRVYVRIGDQIALVPNTLSLAVAKPFADWRDKAALRVEADDVTTLKVQAPDVTATFVAEPKQDDEPRVWKITQPVSADADASAVNAFVSQLASTQTKKFLDEAPKDLKAWGLDKPQAVIEAGDATLKIGRKTSAGYAAQNSASPAVFEIPATLFGLANRPLKEWRSKKFLDFKFEDVSQFEIKARDAAKTLQKQGDKWRLSGGEASDAVHQATFDILLALQGLSAQEFIDHPKSLNAYGLDKPAVEITFNNRIVQLGSKSGKAYARVAKDGNFDATIYELPPSTLDGLKQPLDVLFGKK